LICKTPIEQNKPIANIGIQTANSNEILCVWPNAREACDKK
jgi:hypothetical protein